METKKQHLRISEPTYSIIVPIYNDAYLASAFCEQISLVMCKYLSCTDPQNLLEIIFINDGSHDNSLDELLSLKDNYSFIRIINLSRNFGQHQAIACGFKKAKGSFVARMNVDMQDHPSHLPQLLDKIKNDHCDIVIGRYPKRESPLRDKISAYFYYSLFKFLTGLETPQNTAAMRVMSRNYIDNYNSLREQNRFPQGLDEWLGFNIQYVEIEHKKRADNKSAYTPFSRFKLGLEGLLYFTDRPIVLVIYLGFFCAAAGFFLGAYIVLKKILGAPITPGYTSLLAFGLIAFGVQTSIIGIVGLYIGKIFNEVKRRPLYIIQKEY